MSGLMHGDASDLAAAQAGSAEAFARLYDRHAPVVMALCRGRASHEAEDALQETFIRAFDRLHQVDDAAMLRPWLYAIARHVCRERWRAEARRRHHEHEAMNHHAHLRHEAAEATPDGPAQHEETLDRLTAALDELTEKERLAVHLHYLESDPAHAAAQAMGISRSGFYLLLARAREKLARIMASAAAPARGDRCAASTESSGAADQQEAPRS